MNIYQLFLSYKLDPGKLNIPKNPLDPQSVQNILSIVFMWGGILATLFFFATTFSIISASRQKTAKK